MSNQLSLDIIVDIEELLDEQDTIDIECSGNRLFFANNILTHNSGFANSELDETNISDSIGTVMTVDMLFAAISNDELRDRGQMMIKQIKNRYNDPGFYNKFFIGVDRSRMKLYDLPESVSNAGQSSQQTNTRTTTDTYDDVLNKTAGWNSDKDDSYDFDGLTF